MDRRFINSDRGGIYRFWKMKKTIIISLGGSIIFPGRIDHIFLKNFRKLILKLAKKGNRFAIYCGGGKIARDYQKAASKIIGYDKESLDWIGIAATYLNAFLLRTIFHKFAEEKIIEDPTKKIRFKKQKPILLCAGWKPGWSTDYDAVLLAKNLKIGTVVNMTNVNYVYDQNPKKYKNAKPIKEITWKNFKKIMISKWDPGLNVPFDPIAAKEAEKSGLRVIIMGKDLNNLKNFLNGKDFKGTIIK